MKIITSPHLPHRAIGAGAHTMETVMANITQAIQNMGVTLMTDQIITVPVQEVDARLILAITKILWFS